MANDKVSLWGDILKFGRPPTSGEMLVGNGSGFDLTTSNIIWGNPIEFTVPIKVDGQVWSTTTGFKFPDGTVQSSAATSYSPPTVANNTIQSNVSGSTASPSANTLTQVLDSTASGTQGSILYRGASSWTALGPGTSGQFLQSGGSGANPSWSSGSTAWTLVKKTATQTGVGSSFQNDAELYFSVVSGTTYTVRGVYFVNPAGSISVGFPTSNPSYSNLLGAGTDTEIGTTYVYDQRLVGLTSQTRQVLAFNFTVTASASGTFYMGIAASSTSSAFLKGSYIEYMTI
jgi:hypothetical protein